MLLVLALGVVAGGGPSAAAASTGERGLREAARGYAEAFLHGTGTDFATYLGEHCTPRTPSGSAPTAAELDAGLQALRAGLSEQLGRELEDVLVTKVRVRNVTATKGEAQAYFNVGPKRAGNANWVQFKREDRAWVVRDCELPIGGFGTSVTADGP